MALRLIPEAEFFAQLQGRGFEKTDLQDGDITVWNLEGEPYTVPMPLHKDDGHNLYCPFAIELFFKHVFGEDSDIETNQHSDMAFNVVPIKSTKTTS